MIQFWAVVVVLVIVMIVIAAVTGNNRSPNGGSSTAATPHAGPTGATGATETTTPTTSAPTTSTPPTPQTPQTLQSQKGTGTQSLSPFTVPSGEKGWLIHYLYDCANVGQPGQFAISVQDVNGQPVDVAANLVGTSGGSTYYRDSVGTYRLEVTTECNWAVIVQTVPQ